MFSSTFLTLALALLAAASPIQKRDAAAVEADLAAVSSATTTLDNAVLAFSATSGSLAQALAIHQDATNLESAVTKTTTDTKAAGKFSEADGTTILNDVKALQPIIIKALSDVVAKKPGFDRIFATSIVASDLNNLNTDTQALENALLAGAPADLLPSATPIVNAINAAFTSAIAAYS